MPDGVAGAVGLAEADAAMLPKDRKRWVEWDGLVDGCEWWCRRQGLELMFSPVHLMTVHVKIDVRSTSPALRQPPLLRVLYCTEVPLHSFQSARPVSFRIVSYRVVWWWLCSRCLPGIDTCICDRTSRFYGGSSCQCPSVLSFCRSAALQANARQHMRDDNYPLLPPTCT
jgi:hypothetical protein